jgi:hypothetical protein
VHRKIGSRLTVDKVLICIIRSPYRHVIRRWNWKAASLSAIFRGILILAVNISISRNRALGAMSAEVCYRAITSGFYSSITQSFRYAQPSGAAYLTSMILIPLISDTMQLAIHALCGAPRLGATFVATIVFTVFSTMVELFAMRHGIFVIGRNSNSLLQDIRSIPKLIGESACEFAQCMSSLISNAWNQAAIRIFKT